MGEAYCCNELFWGAGKKLHIPPGGEASGRMAALFGVKKAIPATMSRPSDITLVKETIGQRHLERTQRCN
jgi:hypothetical protein